jgi:hypothetical protein
VRLDPVAVDEAGGHPHQPGWVGVLRRDRRTRVTGERPDAAQREPVVREDDAGHERDVEGHPDDEQEEGDVSGHGHRILGRRVGCG